MNNLHRWTDLALLNASEAANDERFAAPKSRSAVVRSSLTAVAGLPRHLKIFRIAGSRYWQVRIFNHGRYCMRSLKTTDAEQAKVLARYFYADLLGGGRIKQALKLASTSDERSVQKMQVQWHDAIQEILQIERDKVSRNEIRLNSYKMTKCRFEGLIFDFFKSYRLEELSSELVMLFVKYLTDKQLATPTIQGYLSHLNKLSRLVFQKGLIGRLPLMPQIKIQNTSRGAFTLTEYHAILRCSKKLQNQKFSDWSPGARVWIKEQYHHMPKEMNWLIRFMVYTFVRPGDIRQLQNRHIEIVKNSYRYLRLNSPEIKRHRAPTISLPSAVSIYEQILAHQAMRGYGRPDDYVFFPEEPNRALALDIAGWLFNWILHDLGLKRGPHGIGRTLYSLRHTSITFRLIYGGNIDLLTLARNARTSIEMIDKFYASTLSAEMNIALLHGKRR